MELENSDRLTEGSREHLLKQLRKQRFFWLSALFILAGGVGGITYAVRRLPPLDSLAEVNVTQVTTTRVESASSYEEARNYTGELLPVSRSELSFDRPGIVSDILVMAGQGVEQGSPLATLDTRSLQTSRQELLAKRSQAEAQLDEMLSGPRPETIAAAAANVRILQEKLELAQRVSSRRETLYQMGAISLEQLDEAKSEVTTLQARIDESLSQLQELEAGTRSEQIKAQNASIRQLDANIANIDIDLEKSTITAPFSGKISARLLDKGTTVAAGQTVLTLVQDDTLEAHVGISATSIDSVPPQSAQVLQIGQRTYSARVVSTLPELDPETRTLTVVLALDEVASAELVAGQVVQLLLSETVFLEGFWLPTTALVGRESGLWSCYALGESPERLPRRLNGEPVFQVERRDLEILYAESDRVFVRGTLRPGDQVITEGTHRLVPGQWVSPSS